MAAPASAAVRGKCACDADCFDSLKGCTASEPGPAGNSTFQLSAQRVQLSSDPGRFIN